MLLVVHLCARRRSREGGIAGGRLPTYKIRSASYSVEKVVRVFHKILLLSFVEVKRFLFLSLVADRNKENEFYGQFRVLYRATL